MNITDIVRSSDYFSDLLMILDDSWNLEITEFDFTIRKLAHQDDILRLKNDTNLIKSFQIQPELSF